MQAIGDLADTPLGRAAAPGFSSRASMARSTPSYPERVSRPASTPKPDATPAGAVVAIRSGATAGETAADEGEVSPSLNEHSSAPISETVTPGSLTAAPSEAAASESLDQGADARVGGGDASHIPTQSAQFAMPSGAGEGNVTPADPAPAADAKSRFALPPAKPMRPNCRHPDRCGGYGMKHCFTCEQTAKAPAEIEVDPDLPAALLLKTNPIATTGDRA